MKLTKAQIKVIDKARTNPVVETLEADGSKTYRSVDGKNIRSDLFGRLLITGLLVPQNDGLFAGFSQTYLAVNEAVV
ncbi:hypothetical protein GCM10010967_57880 [Dyadobacter beijingensis]|uniref:Uncharacterized protein n=1 Tax=Dyadobacter beijingensis TaxID=365489 RepID=A0ABQ2IKJ4_9BACT|nr:hypothetical protein [Dyadobacter beijingensis]GGN14070.1 hypothetical protein GCM10010967_57880 [Dyadobacter beijingensis]